MMVEFPEETELIGRAEGLIVLADSSMMLASAAIEVLAAEATARPSAAT